MVEGVLPGFLERLAAFMRFLRMLETSPNVYADRPLEALGEKANASVTGRDESISIVLGWSSTRQPFGHRCFAVFGDVSVMPAGHSAP
jgi:hypothetical protein